MKRIRALLLSVGLPALALLGLMLFAAVEPAVAQEDEWHLVRITNLWQGENTFSAGSGDCAQYYQLGSDGLTYSAGYTETNGCAGPQTTWHYGVFPGILEGGLGVVFDYVGTLYGTHWINPQVGALFETGRDFALSAGSGRVCFDNASSAAWDAEFNCDIHVDIGVYGTMEGGGIGINLRNGFGGSGINQSMDITITAAYWVMPGPDTTPPGPEEFQGWIGPAYTCVLTTTLNITDTSGLNFTHTVQYERPANFLRNADFEEPEGNKARYWTPVVNGTGNLDIPNHYLITLNPDTGKQDRVLVDIQEYGYWQGNWLGGKQFTALFGAEANGSGVSILYDSITVATSVYDTLTYFVPFSGTQAVGGGAPFFRIEFPGLNGQTWVDNAFLYPWDEETETVLCDPELFDPYDQEIDGTSGLQDAMLVGGVPAPIAGAGSVCYVCFTPSQIGANAVSLWIAWLGCVLRNMFSCSLRVWLLALGNWTFGLIQWLSALALWIPAEVQNGATWYMRDVVPGLAANVTIVQDGGSNLADVIIAFLALLASLISSLASLTVSVVEFLLSFVQMLQGAINPEPYEFGLDETAPGMSGAGATDAKRLWLFLIGFAVLDQLIMQYPEISGLLMVVTGAAVLGVVYWSFRWWREFINF